MALKLLPSQSEDPLIQALREVVREVVQEELSKRPSSSTPRWVTPAQAGELLGIKPEAVKWRLRQGRLPGRFYGRRWYVDGEALDAAIADSPATLLRNQLGSAPEHKGGRARREPPRP
jgi:hypothetical protein